jgi:hypothetical protein
MKTCGVVQEIDGSEWSVSRVCRSNPWEIDCVWGGGGCWINHAQYPLQWRGHLRQWIFRLHKRRATSWLARRLTDRLHTVFCVALYFRKRNKSAQILSELWVLIDRSFTTIGYTGSISSPKWSTYIVLHYKDFKHTRAVVFLGKAPCRVPMLRTLI